jgi:hypothetical protein
MKNYLLIFLFLLTGIAAHAQAVLRVNNTAGANAPYTTIAAAVVAAGPTDIILVEGSLISYGSLTINKKVTMIGPGYLLTENPGFQATIFPAVLVTITLNSGAAGSSFAGLSFSNNRNFILNSVGNISITSCYFEGCNGSGGGGIDLNGTASNVIIRGNYFTLGCQGITISGSYTGVIITNNVLRETDTGGSSICLIANNIFYSNSNLQNSTVSNNIFRGPAISNVTGSNIKNNIFFSGAQTGADATNLFNSTDASLFSGVGADTYWKLKVGSPAIGFGESGVDCGIYGGATPYRPSGISAGQPTITSFSSPGTVTQNGTLNMKVSAKVN